MGKSATYLPTKSSWPIELGLMAAVGLFFGLAGLYNTSEAPLDYRIGYWLPVMVLGGMIVMLTEQAWRHVPITILQTPAASFVVVTAIATSGESLVVAIFDKPHDVAMPAYYYIGQLWLNVLIVMVPMVAMMRVLRVFLLRAPVTNSNKGPDAVRSDEPEPDDTAVPALIARLLRAPLRTSTLHAIQAEDHYIRVFTADGEELVKMRFADALASLEDRTGYRLHRSWWAAKEAIVSAKFSRGSGEITLQGDITAPLSRTYVGALREAGFLNR